MMNVAGVAELIRAVQDRAGWRVAVTSVHVDPAQYKAIEDEVLQTIEQHSPRQHCDGCKCDRSIRVLGVSIVCDTPPLHYGVTSITLQERPRISFDPAITEGGRTYPLGRPTRQV